MSNIGLEAANDFIAESDLKFSGKTKRVRIRLVAYSRHEYTEELDLPIELEEDDLERIASDAYELSDGSMFNDDPDYWEKGDRTAEVV